MLSDKHGRSGRLRTVRTPEKIAEVRESVTRSPKKSLEVRRQELGISKQMTAVTLKQELKLFPYKISTHHKLIDSDISRRLAMCEKLHRKMEDHPQWVGKVISDEAHIHLNGAICSQNNRFWGSEQPDECEIKCLKGPKITCFVALSAD